MQKMMILKMFWLTLLAIGCHGRPIDGEREMIESFHPKHSPIVDSRDSLAEEILKLLSNAEDQSEMVTSSNRMTPQKKMSGHFQSQQSAPEPGQASVNVEELTVNRDQDSAEDYKHVLQLLGDVLHELDQAIHWTSGEDKYDLEPLASEPQKRKEMRQSNHDSLLQLVAKYTRNPPGRSMANRDMQTMDEEM